MSKKIEIPTICQSYLSYSQYLYFKMDNQKITPAPVCNHINIYMSPNGKIMRVHCSNQSTNESTCACDWHLCMTINCKNPRNRDLFHCRVCLIESSKKFD